MEHFFDGITTIEELTRKRAEVMKVITDQYTAKVKEIRENAPQYKPVKITSHAEVIRESLPELILLQRSGASVNSPVLTIDLGTQSANY